MTDPINNKILAAMPGTALELSTKLGLSMQSTCRRLRLLRAKKLVHVESHRSGTPRPAAVWTAGPGTDAVYVAVFVRPKKVSVAAESIVASARMTQPNSVWDLGFRAQV